MARKQFAWKAGARLASDPVEAGTFLERLRKQHGGELTPQIVLEAARDENSPIHGDFTWDDTEAAQAYRIEQAKYVIRMLVVVTPQASTPIRALVSITDGDSPTYKGVEEVKRDPKLLANVLSVATRELIAFRNKYAHYGFEELEDVMDAIEKVEANRAEAQV